MKPQARQSEVVQLFNPVECVENLNCPLREVLPNAPASSGLE
jgi:hypothetical protein